MFAASVFNFVHLKNCLGATRQARDSICNVDWAVTAKITVCGYADFMQLISSSLSVAEISSIAIARRSSMAFATAFVVAAASSTTQFSLPSK